MSDDRSGPPPGDGSRASSDLDAPPPVELSPSALEAPEIAGYRDLWAAAPPALVSRYGLAHASIAGADCTVARALPGTRILNHALGLRADEPELAAALEAIEEFFAGAGAVLLAVPEGAPIERALAARGYRRDYAWMKFARAGASPADVACPLTIRPVATADAERMGELIAAGFGLPADMASWFAVLVGRTGWHCLGAYDGALLVGCGALYVAGSGGWLTWAATDPPHRGRGAQKALLATRIAYAEERGLGVLVTETGEQQPGRPEASYRNIVAAGFRPVFLRPFWRRDLDGRAQPEEAHGVDSSEEDP